MAAAIRGAAIQERGRPHLAFAALVAAAWLGLHAAGAPAQAPQPDRKIRHLSTQNKPWTGDFDRMLERRMIRVLVPYSRTLFFVDKGRERGVTADHVRDFERYINQRYAKQLGKRPLTVYIVATTRDKLLSGVAEGLGDIAAGNLTDTDERRKSVDFVTFRDGKPVRELVVTGPRSPPIATLDDLSGRTVHVRKSTSYHESVLALNERLRSEGKEPVVIAELPDALEDEDQLEMLNAGLLDYVIVDEWKAEMWAQILPRIKVRDDLVMRAEGYVGWAVRKNSPALQAAIMDAYNNVVGAQGGMSTRRAQYHRNIKQITNNTASAEMQRFERTIRFFEKYGSKYGFDPLMLAAQGYQESRLDQDARSHVGAVGIMQIMPATGAGLGVGSIYVAENNIHGGAKYMDQLMTVYFKDASFSEYNRALFAFASYNAGPGNVAWMRKEAARRGLDPDKWFNNVEVLVAEKIGVETTTYVRNIYKYYVAYKLIVDAQDAARKAREAFRATQS
jgi:membrane-bound lytic murein transglycosylase MltF